MPALTGGGSIMVKAAFSCKDCQGGFLEYLPYLLSHGCRSLWFQDVYDPVNSGSPWYSLRSLKDVLRNCVWGYARMRVSQCLPFSGPLLQHSESPSRLYGGVLSFRFLGQPSVLMRGKHTASPILLRHLDICVPEHLEGRPPHVLLNKPIVKKRGWF